MLLSPAESPPLPGVVASGSELLRDVRGMGFGGEWLPLAEFVSSAPDEDASSLLPVECSVGDSLSSTWTSFSESVLYFDSNLRINSL